jgi:TolA-binding protein
MVVKHWLSYSRHLALTVLLCVCTTCLFGIRSARAAEEFDIDMMFVNELNERELYDFSAMQLEQMLQKYPQKKDAVLVEAARTYYASGKSKQADAALAQIKPDSDSYLEALMLSGEVAAARKKNDQAAKIFAEYFKRVKPPKGDNESDVERYRRAVSIYSHVLKQLGKGDEAAKIIGLLGEIEGEGAASDRQMVFLKNQAILDAAEEKLDDRQAIDRSAVQKAMNAMEQLQFIRDGVAAASFLETARGHVLLGGDSLNRLMAQKKLAEVGKISEFIDAIKVLKMAGEFLEEIEKTVVKGGDKSRSPLAGALFYKGRALRGQAFVALAQNNEEQARKLTEAAARYFETVVVDYGDSAYRMKALNEHGKCSAFMEQKFGEKIELAQANMEAEMELKMDQAAAFVQAENYAEAIPLYLEAVRVGRRSKRLPEVVKRLVVCYGHEKRFLEAEALVSYLVDVLPDDEGTPESAFRLGAVIYEAAKKIGNTTERDALLGQAMSVWESFVDTAPGHPKAADVAFVIAEHYYRVASDIAEKARTAGGTAAREELKTKARDAYLEAVPKYQRLVDQYSSFDKGIRALYKLGWIYYSTDQPKECADAFLRYCELESDPAKSDDRLEAKFRAAEQMMLGDYPEEAIAQFQELLSWYEPDAAKQKGLNTRTSAARRIQEDATSYLAWSYDLTAELGRPRMTQIRNEIRSDQSVIGEMEKLVQQQDAILAELGKEREEADREFRDLEQLFTNISFDFRSAAREQALKQAENTQNMTAEEKAAAERNLDADIDRLAADLERRAVAGVEGERLAREQERETIKTAKDESAATLETLRKKLADQQQKLAEIRTARQKVEKELKELQETMTAANKAVVEGEAESRRLSDELEQLKEKGAQAGEAQQKRQILEKAREVAAAINECQRRLNEAHARRDRIVTPENERKVTELTAQISEHDSDIAAQQTLIRQIEQEVAVAEKDAEILQARLIGAAKALEFNEETGKVLERPAPEREAQVERLKKLGSEALENFRKVKELKVERIVLLQNRAKDRIAGAKERIEEANKAIAALNETLKPVRETFTGWKEKAQTAFNTFLNEYPKSKHVPDNMSRLGTIYIELEEFDKASSILKRLATEYPDSPASKLALFNLGRAQAEEGKDAEAKASFEDLLVDPANVSSPNLSYISETMLETGHPNVSLNASRELLNRSEDQKHPDYETLRERSREPTLFRAGTAALRTEQYEDALTYFKKLLDEHPNTGYFFDATFGMAEARIHLTPPDNRGALADLAQILQYADRPELTNRALCMTGDIMLRSSEEKDVRQGVARLQQVVMLADPELPANRPWIERAIAKSAAAFARLGENEKRDDMLGRYRREFPDGSYADELKALPQQEFATPALNADAGENDAAGAN